MIAILHINQTLHQSQAVIIKHNKFEISNDLLEFFFDLFN